MDDFQEKKIRKMNSNVLGLFWVNFVKLVSSLAL